WTALLHGDYIRTHSRAKIETDVVEARIYELARRAAHQALAGATITNNSDLAIIIGTSKGPVESWLTTLRQRDLNAAVHSQQAGASHSTRDAGVSPAFPPSRSERDTPSAQFNPLPSGLSDIASDLAEHLNLPQSIRLTTSAACASGLHALIRAAML